MAKTTAAIAIVDLSVALLFGAWVMVRARSESNSQRLSWSSWLAGLLMIGSIISCAWMSCGR